MDNWLLTPVDYPREAMRTLFRAVDSVINRQLDTHIMNLLQSMLRPVSKAKLPDGSIVVYPFLNPPCGALWDIYVDNVYFSEFTPESGDTIVDVGATIGLFTIRAWKLKKEKGLVVSIEPYPTAYEFLLRNVAVNSIRSVALNVALETYNGYTKFAMPGGQAGWGSTNVTQALKLGLIKRMVRVRVLRLDTVTKVFGLKGLDFLKIDAEGAERDILRGADILLGEKKIKRIVVAAYHWATEAEEVASLLRKQGCDVKIRSGYVYASHGSHSDTSTPFFARHVEEGVHNIW